MLLSMLPRADLSNLNSGWNKLYWLKIITYESEETADAISVDEIVQFCNSGLNSKIISTKEVID